MITDLRKIIEIAEFIQGIYYNNQRIIDGHFEICCKYAQLTNSVVKFNAFSVGSCGVACGLIPVIAYLITGEFFAATGNFVPGISADTLFGWILLIIIDAIVIACGCFIAVSFDGLCYAIFANMLMVASILRDSLIAFGELMQTKQLALAQCRRIFLNSITMHLKYSL